MTKIITCTLHHFCVKRWMTIELHRTFHIGHNYFPHSFSLHAYDWNTLGLNRGMVMSLSVKSKKSPSQILQRVVSNKVLKLIMIWFECGRIWTMPQWKTSNFLVIRLCVSWMDRINYKLYISPIFLCRDSE